MKMDEYLILFFNELDRNGVLSDNNLKQTQNNTVVYEIDKKERVDELNPRPQQCANCDESNKPESKFARSAGMCSDTVLSVKA